MGDALQIDALWSGINSPYNGQSWSGAIVATYASGTSTPKAVWTNKEKTTPSALGQSQFVLDSNGQAFVFGDGKYKISIFAPTDTGLTNPLITIDGTEYVTKSQLSLTALLSDYDGSFPAAKAALGTVNDVHLIVDTDPDDLAAAIVFPDNYAIEWRKGHPVDGAFTFTMNGSLIAGDYKLFESAVTVDGTPMVESVPPEWFGGEVSASSATNKAAIESALSFANGIPVIASAGGWSIAAGVSYAGPVNIQGVGEQFVTWDVSTDADFMSHDLKNGHFWMSGIRLEYSAGAYSGTLVTITRTGATLPASQHYIDDLTIEKVRFIDSNVGRTGTGLFIEAVVDFFIFFPIIRNNWFVDLAVGTNLTGIDSGTFGSINGSSFTGNKFIECLTPVRTRGKVHTLMASDNHLQFTTIANGHVAGFDLEGSFGKFRGNLEHDLDTAAGAKVYLYRNNLDGSGLSSIQNSVSGSLHSEEEAVTDSNPSATLKQTNTFYDGGVITDTLNDNWPDKSQIKTGHANLDMLTVNRNRLYLDNEIIVTQATTPVALENADSGATITNRGATGAAIFNLPTAPRDGVFFFVNKASIQDLSLDPASKQFGANTAGKLWQNLAGERFVVSTIKWYEGDGVWLILPYTGTWTIQP